MAVMTLRILYNGACPICAREIGLYRRRARSTASDIVFEDLNRTDLSAWHLDPDTARRRLHALHAGQRLDGLDAFRALWAHLSGWRWLAALTGLPGINGAIVMLYDRVLAPWLYRRSAKACADMTEGACHTEPDQ